MAIIDKPRNKTYLIGNWMPSDQTTLVNWMRKIINKAKISNAPLLPSIQNLKNFIESNPKAYMFFNQMFYTADKKDRPNELPQVRDYQHMLELFNVIMTHAPDFDETGLVGFPFNAILDWSMATNSGWSAFLDDEINVHLKAMLNEWAVFLRSPESTYVLNDDPKHGWFGEDAKKAMPTFVSDFKCDPSVAHYGFKSWDDFFTREFRQGVRPIAEPDNNRVVIIGLMCFMAVGMAEVSTCEITVYEGQYITKGQEIGMFHFGGSTHCLIFRPEVSLEFDLHGQTPSLDSNNIPINSRIATVK